MKFLQYLLVLFSLSISAYSKAQDSLSSSSSISQKYLVSVSQKTKKLADNLNKKSRKALAQFQKQEGKVRKKLSNIDSAKAKAIFNNAEDQYKSLEDRLQNDVLSKPYIPSLDTIATSLKFLQQNPELLAKVKNGKIKLEEAIGKVKGLQGNLQKADEIKRFLKERKQYLKDQLATMGFAKQLKRLNKQTYYLTQQINEYKSLLKDHKKAERKAIGLLTKTKLFKDFMRKNSQLASLFRLPGNPSDPTSQIRIAGLQTRAQVNTMIQQQLATGGPNGMAQFRQNLDQAKNQLNQLKSKVSKLGGGTNDLEMPEGFKPNNQKTKSFLKRLEFGTNIQSQKANGFFPTTSDIGLSLGYKLNDKSTLGIGASYKMGLGKDIRHLHVTHQGIGLRSFADLKVKGSFWLSGGYEINYRSEFRSIDALKDYSAWQKSGLIGITKSISIQSKYFKKTKLQLLWDMLSYEQIPRTQPILFRIGYNF